MAGELADEVRVFDFLIKVADEGPPGHVRAGNVADGVLLRLLGAGVDDGHDAVDSGFLEPLADEVVELACAVEGEDGVPVAALVTFQYLDGGGGQIHLDYARTFFFGLAGDILHGDAVVGGDYVVLGEGEEVADTAADVALEDEDVPGLGEVFIIAHVRLVQQVALLGGEIVGGTVLLGADGVFAEGIVPGVAHVNAPAPVCADGAHVADDGVVAPLAGSPFVLGVVPGVFVLFHRPEAHAVFQLGGLEKGVFGAEEFFEGDEGLRCGFVQDDLLAFVEFVALDDAEDCVVGVDALQGDFLVLEEVFGLVQEADFITVRLGIVLGIEETVYGVLRPVLSEVFRQLVVAFLQKVSDDPVDGRLGIKSLADLGSDDAIFDDDFVLLEELREEEDMGVRTERDRPRVAVAEKDFGLAGVLVGFARKRECNCCHSFYR